MTGPLNRKSPPYRNHSCQRFGTNSRNTPVRWKRACCQFRQGLRK
jgi:hypothetical protein